MMEPARLTARMADLGSSKRECRTWPTTARFCAVSLTGSCSDFRILAFRPFVVSLYLEGLVMSLVKIIVITIIVILSILLFGRFFL
jgi:hypothetical protein